MCLFGWRKGKKILVATRCLSCWQRGKKTLSDHYVDFQSMKMEKGIWWPPSAFLVNKVGKWYYGHQVPFLIHKLEKKHLMATRGTFTRTQDERAPSGHDQVNFILNIRWKGTQWPPSDFLIDEEEIKNLVATKCFFLLTKRRKGTWWPLGVFLVNKKGKKYMRPLGAFLVNKEVKKNVVATRCNTYLINL